MLYESDGEASNVGLAAEHTKRHDRVTRESTFVENKQDGEKGANGDEADDLWRVPRICSTSKVQPKQNHYHDSYHRNTARPINGFDAFSELGPWVMDIQKNQ